MSVKKKTRKPQWYEWTVKLKVHRSWVADGFDLDNELAHEMLCRFLPQAYGNEVKARVIAKPDKRLIMKEQGG